MYHRWLTGFLKGFQLVKKKKKKKIKKSYCENSLFAFPLICQQFRAAKVYIMA